jgi:hypothetical protein
MFTAIAALLSLALFAAARARRVRPGLLMRPAARAIRARMPE